MPAPAVVWLIVGLGTLIILVALVVGLVRQVNLLARSLAELQEAVRPVLEGMREDVARAQEHAERLRRTEISFGDRTRSRR
jgi:hypothetical protein